MRKQTNRIPALLARKEMLENTRYSQKDIAEGTGLTGPAISRIMRHDTIDNVSYFSAKAIAQWLGVSMEELGEAEEEGE